MIMFGPEIQIHLGFCWLRDFFSHLRADHRFQPTELDDGWWVAVLVEGSSRVFNMSEKECTSIRIHVYIGGIPHPLSVKE